MNNSNNTNKLSCNNCGRTGHMFYQCKLPISSYGIIIFKLENNIRKYLMLRRKDSFGYIDFIRGKYSIYNKHHLQNILNEMSIAEKSRLTQNSFSDLWNELWINKVPYYKNEEINSEKKFNILINDPLEVNFHLHKLLNDSNTNWVETEWEFPKGRRNLNESDIDCALREFEEETGINKNEVNLIQNLLTFEESFIGSNNKPYKHKYFIGTLKNDINYYNLNSFQITEVSKLEWKSLDECLQSIRPYNYEKKKVISIVDNVLDKYRIFI
jgi:8-oxo-dGTP pyrophosphatase MutT (NUDIX family)